MRSRTARTTILVVEDNSGDVRLLREMLNEEGSHNTRLIHVETLGDAEVRLREDFPDLILLDLGLPDSQGLDAVGRIHAAAPRVPIVVLTGLDDESVAAHALQQGAQDYLIKGQIDGRSLLRAIRYAFERKEMDDALFAEKERAQVTLKSIGDAVVCTNGNAEITFLNVVAERLTGWSIAEAIGRPIREVLCFFDLTSGLPAENPMTLSGGIDSDTKSQPNWVLIRRDGVETPIQESAAPIHDSAGNATGSVMVIRDVSATRAMALLLTHTAQHDFLTGLPNRLLLNERIDQSISLAKRHEKKVAVLFLDLDGFKHVNDSLGHPTGDRLLQSITARLLSSVRDSDTVSRQGGDEFVVLLSEVDNPEAAAASANRILAAIAQPHSIDQQQLHVTASIGVSLFPDDGADAEALIKNADTAMFQAKEHGRQGFKFFKDAMYAEAAERQSIEEDLRCAMDRQEFSLSYQPKVDLASGRITGAEALLRWKHPTRGQVPPAQFIPVAEDCGLIVPIGNWVLGEACRQARAWADAGLPVSVAVNVSAIELRQDGFLAGVGSILEDTGLDPSSLELELTESVLMRRTELTAAILGNLRQRGVRIAIDDFGTGYSSLSYLTRFPIDTLKIDQSFVRRITGGITGAPAETSIVTAVIGIARGLALRVVAEGVETQEELRCLRSLGCDEAQGYFFSHPVPAAEFTRLLLNRPAAWIASMEPRFRGLPSRDGELAGVDTGVRKVAPRPALAPRRSTPSAVQPPELTVCPNRPGVGSPTPTRDGLQPPAGG